MDFALIKGFLDGLKPEPRLSVDKWADKFRYLSPTSSAEPGLWRTSRTPYLKEIMERLSSSDPCQEVIFMKGAQIGATEMGFNWLGYIIDLVPAPTLIVQPTDETVKRASKMRLDPMIEATPRLRDKIKPARSRDSGNTTYQKDFPGGTVVLTGANSAAGLRSMPVRFLMLDECDAYPLDLDGEGSPIDLARRRTSTFSRKKIFLISTPTVEGVSVIEREFKRTSQRYYYVPCPECGTFQRLIWANLQWIKGQPETARYVCEHCAHPIEDRHKTQMLADGEWRSTVPDNESERVYGYHLSSLYSPFGWYSWADAAREWEDAQNDTPKLKTFINTVLGETWKEKGEAPPWENLYNKREPYKLNAPSKEVVFLTAGVDVQKDRLELEIVGWCRGRRSYSIDYRVILGDTSHKEVWDKLASVLGETWAREDGVMMPLRLMAVDTGYNTQHAYDFCRRFDVSRVIPVKGQDKQAIMIAPPRAVDVSIEGKKIGEVKVWNVGVSLIKSELYGWLRLNKDESGTPPPGYCHFPEYDAHYFKGLTAEQLQFSVDKKGYKKYEWVKKYERNEPLDCRVYARAAANVIGIDRFEAVHYEAMEKELMPRIEEKKNKRTSSFWQ